MNTNFSHYLRITLFVILLLLFISISWFHFFDFSLDAFKSGYRYPVLIIELILIPAFALISIIQLIFIIYRERMISRSTVYLMLKYFGLLIFMIFVLLLASILFNNA
ncbi:MAG TPA: hypothetical protein VFG10_12570 [Saprospiraceae bacterium]|nr:hypothetical protein [Saprospiraceae bacterium]